MVKKSALAFLAIQSYLIFSLVIAAFCAIPIHSSSILNVVAILGVWGGTAFAIFCWTNIWEPHFLTLTASPHSN